MDLSQFSALQRWEIPGQNIPEGFPSRFHAEGTSKYFEWRVKCTFSHKRINRNEVSLELKLKANVRAVQDKCGKKIVNYEVDRQTVNLSGKVDTLDDRKALDIAEEVLVALETGLATVNGQSVDTGVRMEVAYYKDS